MTDSEIFKGMLVVITQEGVQRALDEFESLYKGGWKEFFAEHIGEVWKVSGSAPHHYIGITYHFYNCPEGKWVVPAIMLDPISCSDECNAQSDITVLFSGGGG